MAVEAELVDEVSRRAKTAAAGARARERGLGDAAPGEEVRQLLADVVLAAEAIVRARVEQTAADARRECAAVEEARRHGLEALAADDAADLARRVRSQSAFVRATASRDATERHADP